MSRQIAIYVRVSTTRQDTRSQLPDLKRWVAAFADGQGVQWYDDKATGKNMDRPGWRRLEEDMLSGRVSKIVVWRLDRLGRTAAGLTALFEQLQRRGVGFESLRDKVDLATPAGRLMANVLASVAAYENEVRSERVRAGQAAARAAGKNWGGSRAGIRKKVTPDQEQVIWQLSADQMPVSRIARTVGVSRPTVYAVLAGEPPNQPVSARRRKPAGTLALPQLSG